MSYDERDVVLLLVRIELADVTDNRVDQGRRRECPMTVQRLDQPMIAELFAAIVEGFGCAVGIENEGIARK